MPQALETRAAPLVGVVLGRRDCPTDLGQWPEFLAQLHPTPRELLTVYWSLERAGDFHLNLLGSERIPADEVATWLLPHGWLLLATGPDGSFITCSNDDRLQITYISMQESIGLMDEGGRPAEESVCETSLDVFDLLRALDWMDRASVDGYFPDHLEVPIPLDFYDAKDWMSAGDH